MWMPRGVVTNASQRWMTSIAPAAAHAGAASAHRGRTPCGSSSDALDSAPVVRRRLKWRAPLACRAGGGLGGGPSAPDLRKLGNFREYSSLLQEGWWLRVGMWWRQGALRGVHSPVAIESRFGVADAVGDQLPRLARSGSWACRGLGCRTLALFRRPIEVSSRPWNPGQAFAVRHPSVPAGCIRELPRVRAALRAWRCHRRRSKSSFRSGSAQSR